MLHLVDILPKTTVELNRRRKRVGSPDPKRRGTRSMIQVKRIYDPPGPSDGFRVLVDRLWPRGLSKDEVAIDLWLKEIAPTTELRRWFHQDPGRWEDFRRRYEEELEGRPGELDLLRQKVQEGDVTLLYAAKTREHNHAMLLKARLEQG